MQKVYSCFAQHVLIELIFITIGLKLLFLPRKYKTFGALGAPPPDPCNSPPLQNSDYVPAPSTDSLVEE